ncbi:MAG: sulfite exporter TauE/SafE family protein [Rhodospirillales bacterium]
MLDAALQTIGHLDPWTLGLIASLSFGLSIFHSFNGFAGGLLLAIFLAPVIGIKAIVPVMALGMFIDHIARTWIFRHGIEWRPVGAVMILGVPGIIAGATIYSFMDTSAIALLLAVFLAISVPARRFFNNRNVAVNTTGLVLAGGGWGLIAGPTVGPGIFLVPFLLGAGITGERFIATITAIALVANFLKTLVFGKFTLLTPEHIAAGVLIGLCSIPGTYVGRWIVRRTPIRIHTGFVEAVVILGAVNFLWIAAQGFKWISP